MKTIRVLLVSTVIFSTSIIPVFAQDTTDPTGVAPTHTESHANTAKPGTGLLNDIGHMQQQASHAATVQQSRLPEIIANADALIIKRQSSLQSLFARIQSDKHLTTEEKTSLTTDVTAQISALTALKTKIDADTDAATALADAKQIITNYYIYMVFQPKMQMLITLGNLQSIVADLQAAVPQLQAIITQYGAGKDVTQLQAYLDDMKAQLATTSTSIAADITTVDGVSTASPTTAHTTIITVKTDISSVIRSGLQKVSTDIGLMRPLFRALILPNGTGGTETGSSSANTHVLLPNTEHVRAGVSSSPSTTLSPSPGL